MKIQQVKKKKQIINFAVWYQQWKMSWKEESRSNIGEVLMWILMPAERRSRSVVCEIEWKGVVCAQSRDKASGRPRLPGAPMNDTWRRALAPTRPLRPQLMRNATHGGLSQHQGDSLSFLFYSTTGKIPTSIIEYTLLPFFIFINAKIINGAHLSAKVDSSE